MGQALPPWTAGYLDIHQINTGNGNSTLFILPNGSCLMRDAGWGGNEGPGEDVLTRIYSERLYPGPRDVFATNMTAANRAVIGSNLDRLKSSQGAYRDSRSARRRRVSGADFG